jgi:hypothetical protein
VQTIIDNFQLDTNLNIMKNTFEHMGYIDSITPLRKYGKTKRRVWKLINDKCFPAVSEDLKRKKGRCIQNGKEINS